MRILDLRQSSRVAIDGDLHLKAMIESMVREGFSEREIIRAVRRATRS
jgi:predicted membrane GTPase involved in stress response